MDIKQAKQELRCAMLSYTERNIDGTLAVPTVRQRPLLLMGPPGVGKTAILYQLAAELHTNLVSYTMTHHTRQSALGLPLIREKTGIQTGILFLDEINCVSETLMPAMLQLLQSKQFGTHTLPEGWLIAAAGNPPAYNESARSFDTVTMDRVRLLEITESYPVWRDYAHAKGLHPAVLSYLELNPEHFYIVEPHARGRSFVTARGWEDLSEALYSYERLGFEINAALFGEFLQHAEISASFAAFFRLFTSLQRRLDLTEILAGDSASCAPGLQKLPFDARLAAAEFLLHAVSRELGGYQNCAALSSSFSSFCAAIKNEKDPLCAAKENLSRRQRAMQLRKDLGVLPAAEERAERRFAAKAHALLDGADDTAALEQETHALAAQAQALREKTARKLDNAMAFVYETFGAGHELLIFLTQLKNLPGASSFLKESERYPALCKQTLPEELAKTL